MLAVLAHDFGKPATTQHAMKDGVMRIISPGHEEAGAALAAAFLERMRAPQAVQARVLPLVRNHLFHFQSMTDRAVRRLARRLWNRKTVYQGLCLVMTADSMGRPPRPAVEPEFVRQLLACAHELQVRQKPPAPILMGRPSIQLGLEPGKMFGVILHKAYEAQLEGTFGDLPQAWQWLARAEDIELHAEARQRLEKKMGRD